MTNPWLCPVPGPAFYERYERHGKLPPAVHRRVRALCHSRLVQQAVAAGYAPPTPRALAHGTRESAHHDRATGRLLLTYTFPTHPPGGVHLALIDAHWNRTYTHGRQWEPPQDTPVYLDLHTGDWCVFTHNTDLTPLGRHYMHDSPATRYPQPEAP